MMFFTLVGDNRLSRSCWKYRRRSNRP